MPLKAEKIKELRRSKGLSIRDLSKISGISIAHISDMENGQKINTTTDTICKLATALEVKPDDLFSCD